MNKHKVWVWAAIAAMISSEEGTLEIAFGQGAPGRIYQLDAIEALFDEVRALLRADSV